jgi:hypothetical protein
VLTTVNKKQLKPKMKLVKSIKNTAKKSAAPAIPTSVVTSPAPGKAMTTIEARADVGFGNNLFVRGQGAGLSWDRGTPLRCLDGQTWRWSAPAEHKLTFKLLLNDAVWAKGADIVAAPGSRVEVSPAF